jgi:hypothetical protein
VCEDVKPRSILKATSPLTPLPPPVTVLQESESSSDSEVKNILGQEQQQQQQLADSTCEGLQHLKNVLKMECGNQQGLKGILKEPSFETKTGGTSSSGSSGADDSGVDEREEEKKRNVKKVSRLMMRNSSSGVNLANILQSVEAKSKLQQQKSLLKESSENGDVVSSAAGDGRKIKNEAVARRRQATLNKSR